VRIPADCLPAACEGAELPDCSTPQTVEAADPPRTPIPVNQRPQCGWMPAHTCAHVAEYEVSIGPIATAVPHEEIFFLMRNNCGYKVTTQMPPSSSQRATTACLEKVLTSNAVNMLFTAPPGFAASRVTRPRYSSTCTFSTASSALPQCAMDPRNVTRSSSLLLAFLDVCFSHRQA